MRKKKQINKIDKKLKHKKENKEIKVSCDLLGPLGLGLGERRGLVILLHLVLGGDAVVPGHMAGHRHKAVGFDWIQGNVNLVLKPDFNSKLMFRKLNIFP